MRLNKSVAGTGALVLVAGSLAFGMNVGAAQASSQGFTLFSQIAAATQPTPTPEGTQTISMTVTPAVAPPDVNVEVQVSSSTFDIKNGPAATVEPLKEELDAVITLDGQDYVLRGPQNTQTVGLNDETNAAHTGNLLFQKGWVVSSTPNKSSGSSKNQGNSSSGETPAFAAGTAPGTGGIGATKRAAEATQVALKAPTTPGVYPITLKALILNSLESGVNVSGSFDSVFNLCSAAGASALGPKKCFNTNDASGNLVFSTAVTVTSDTAAPTPTGTEAPPTVPPTTKAPTTKTSSTPTKSTSTAVVVNSAPRKKTNNLTMYCQVKNTAVQPDPDKYTGVPVTITVTPGAAKPGSNIKISVSAAKSPKNTGPATLDPKAYRFEANVKFNGENTQLIGPLNSGTVQPNGGTIFANTPTVATGIVTLPATEGEFPITLNDLYYNNVAGTGTAASLTDIFDNRCNASTAPQNSPKAFSQSWVSAESNADAGGGTSGNSDAAADSLAATGPRNTLIVGLIALLALQLGVVLWVRAYRATPRGARHL